MEVVKDEKLRRGIPIDKEADPAYSGLIGSFVSSVTTDAGSLEAKQTSINPNWAAVVIDLLQKAHVREGDPVAVSFSGSFPALNIAVCAALAALNLRPTIISSVSSSQWGANQPGFLWLDIERFLQERGLIPFRSAAASFGGRHDRGREMPEKGRRLVTEAAEKNGISLIRANTLRENIDERMAVYFRSGPPKAYINVGGGRAAVGERSFKALLKPGLLAAQTVPKTRADSAILRFLKEQTPVIQLYDIRHLAREYGLSIAPAAMPAIGEGSVYYATHYNKWLAAAILFGIVFGLFVFSRSDWGFRILQSSSRREEIGPPEPMV